VRRVVPSALFAIALFAPGLGADPLPVHTATQLRPRELRDISAAQRLQAADAVAAALGAVAPEVLSGEETRSRLQTLVPDALACDATACAASITTPLHARGLVLLRLELPRRGRVRVWVGLLGADGRVTVQQESEEAVAGWPEAVALARETARPLVDALRRAAPAATPTAAPVPTPATPPPASAAPVVPAGPDLPHTETYRRIPEAAIGAGLVAVGIGLASTGLVSVLRDGTVAESLANNVDSVYVAGARDYVLLGVGSAAAVAGVVLLVDGLRTRTRTTTPRAMTPGFTVTAQGAAFTLGGQF